MKRVIVHIDRLVLRGSVHGGDGRGLAAGLQAELARALAQPGAIRSLAALGSVASLKAGRVAAPAAAKPHDTGAKVARAIARSIHR
jgi:hypothetical protein